MIMHRGDAASVAGDGAAVDFGIVTVRWVYVVVTVAVVGTHILAAAADDV